VGTKAPLKAIGTVLLIVASTGSNAQTVDFDYSPLAKSMVPSGLQTGTSPGTRRIIGLVVNSDLCGTAVVRVDLGTATFAVFPLAQWSYLSRS